MQPSSRNPEGSKGSPFWGRSVQTQTPPQSPRSPSATQPPQTPSTHRPAFERLRQMLDIGTPPFSTPGASEPRPATPATPPRPTTQPPRAAVRIGGGAQRRAKAASHALPSLSQAQQALFGGTPPVVERSTQAGRLRFRWSHGTAPESLAAEVAVVCRHALSLPDQQAEAIALFDAVYARTEEPGAWHELLLAFGDALSQAAFHMAPQQILNWVRRLRTLGRWAQEQGKGEAAALALVWAQALNAGLGTATRGAAASAIALLRIWEREAKSQASRPPGERPPRLNLDEASASSEPTPHTPPHTPLHTPLHTPSDTPPGSPPETPTQRTPRLAYPQLPEFSTPLEQAHAAQTAGPVNRILWRAHAHNNFHPFIKALFALKQARLQRLPQGSIDDLRRTLRDLLIILGDPNLQPAQRQRLLYEAYPLVCSHADDPLLASDYASAIREHLPAEQAEHLLLALGAPKATLAPSHIYRRRLDGVQRLIDWGLPKATAKRLAMNEQHLWAQGLLFEAPPARPGQRDAPLARLSVQGQGPARTFSLNPGPPLSDAEIDAVLTLAQAWSADADTLAFQLLRATFEAARLDEAHEDEQLRPRWLELVQRLQQHHSFAPWLSVQRTFDAQTGRFGDLKWALDAQQAARATAVERQKAATGLWRWITRQMRTRDGIAWLALTTQIDRIHKALGEHRLFGFEHWLTMAAWELARSDDAEPLAALPAHLDEQHLGARTWHALLQALHTAHTNELVCATWLQLLNQRLPERDGSLELARLHASFLQAVLARTDTDMRHNLVEGYLAEHPFNLLESSGDLLQLLSLLRSDSPPVSTSVWDFLAELDPPKHPASALLWRSLCLQLAPWMARELLACAAVPASPRSGPGRRVLTMVWQLSQAVQEPASQALERQFLWLAELAEAVPPDQALGLLRQLDAACIAWRAELAWPAQHGLDTVPEPPWLMALQAALEVLVVAHGGAAHARPQAPQPTPADFFTDWFAARLLARRGERAQAQALSNRIREQHTGMPDSPVGRLIAEMLQGPLPGTEKAPR